MKPARRFTRAAAALFGRSFDEASDGGRWPQWAGMPAPARHQFAARHQLASRSAYLVANSPSASSIANVWVTSLCGDGPSIRSGHPNAATRRALEDAWSRFYASCDQEGVADLGGMLANLTRSMVSAGEGFLHLFADARGELRLRLLSPAQVDPARTREIEFQERIIAGVEFDASGRRIAYWVFPEQPDIAVTVQPFPEPPP